MPDPLGTSISGALPLISAALAELGLAPLPLLRVWARALPVVAIVPAFGLRALPLGVRAAVALVLAASAAPAAALAAESAESHVAWPLELGLEALGGLSLAIATAVPLWAATMAGSIPDGVLGLRQTHALPTTPEATGPVGAMLSLFAAALFFWNGGPSQLAVALAAPAATNPTSLIATTAGAVVGTLAAGITLAVTLAGPMLATSVVVDVGLFLAGRAPAAGLIAGAVAPLRTLATLLATAFALERIGAAISLR